MQVLMSNEAHEDIDSIFEYISRDSIKYANETSENIYSRIYELENAPYLGRYVPELSDKHYRERICRNYRIIYLVSEKHNTIFIRYIISGKQNSKIFFEVHKKELIEFFNQLFI